MLFGTKGFLGPLNTIMRFSSATAKAPGDQGGVDGVTFRSFSKNRINLIESLHSLGDFQFR